MPSECGRGIKKHGGQAVQALGRSRGSFSTTIHAGCLDAKTGVAIVLTGGERNELPGFDAVFDQVPSDNALEDALLDKGYDRNHGRERLQENDVTPVIPSKSNRQEISDYDQDKYKLREEVERFFDGTLGHFRHALSLSRLLVHLLRQRSLW